MGGMLPEPRQQRSGYNFSCLGGRAKCCVQSAPPKRDLKCHTLIAINTLAGLMQFAATKMGARFQNKTNSEVVLLCRRN
jgi:hypothetical protein